ncbi:MAG: sigma-54 dependent transcriptional regulator [Rickettsiales bacterium]|nr:sigma-54 dependent transcriptional regulator [Rickettsiales bacterium]
MPLDILVIDDEKDIRQLIGDILKDEGYSFRLAADSTEALAALRDRVPSAIILDVWLQGSELDGLGILEIVQKKYPSVPVIVISGHGNIETAVSSIRMGAYDYIEKPFKEEKLLLVLNRGLEIAALRQENRELKKKDDHEAGQLVGRSQSITQLRGSVDKVAPTESRVLITGPSGVGKEVIARNIHKMSRRKDSPFIIFNAASIAPNLIEKELFGLEDAVQGYETPLKTGIFERANGGTLFIDEVTDLPIETQGKLLRLLQEQSLVRVGGERRIKIDVRVIAASSKNLLDYIQQGKFREDLYYRLNVVPIRVPSLSERREDIPMLCQFFLKTLSQTHNLPLRTIGEDAIATMQAYKWPGNVRQLRNVIEWLLIMAPGDISTKIKTNMLPPEITSVTPTSIKTGLNDDVMSMPLREARELFERQYLTAQINRFGGNISRTSSFIGMERSALHRKLKSLRINNDQPVSA